MYNIQLYHVATLVVSISISSRPWLPWHAMTIFQLQRFCAKPWGRQVTVHLMKLWEPFCSMCRSICRHFLEGKCNYGDLCRFSHEVHELLAPVPVQAVSQGRGSTLFQCWKQECCTVPKCFITSVHVSTEGLESDGKCSGDLLFVPMQDRGTMQPAPSIRKAITVFRRFLVDVFSFQQLRVLHPTLLMLCLCSPADSTMRGDDRQAKAQSNQLWTSVPNMFQMMYKHSTETDIHCRYGGDYCDIYSRMFNIVTTFKKEQSSPTITYLLSAHRTWDLCG